MRVKRKRVREPTRLKTQKGWPRQKLRQIKINEKKKKKKKTKQKTKKKKKTKQ